MMVGVRYLDPCNDFAFKKIFGNEKNKDILIHFLNDVLNKKDRETITEVTLIKTDLPPEIQILKESILDVLCTDQNQRQYIVEMQVSRSKSFLKRAQYYAAKAYGNQLKKGDKYHLLKEVIFLAILDFTIFPEKLGYKSDHIILDKKDYTHHLKDFSFTFIELPKFNQEKPEELITYEEKWCYFFKYADDPEHMQRFLATIGSEPNIIRKAYDVLDAHYWSIEELNGYESVQKAIMDKQAREDYITEEAEARGEARGEALGIAKGAALAKAELSQKLKEAGFDDQAIAEFMK